MLMGAPGADQLLGRLDRLVHGQWIDHDAEHVDPIAGLPSHRATSASARNIDAWFHRMYGTLARPVTIAPSLRCMASAARIAPGSRARQRSFRSWKRASVSTAVATLLASALPALPA